MKKHYITAGLSVGLAVWAGFVAVDSAQASMRPARTGAVYVLSNQTAGNSIISYRRSADGALSPAGSVATGGTGTGTGLGSQNALVLDASSRHLYAVNAGSDSITSFAVTSHGLRRESTVPSGGDEPVSVSVRKDRVFVVNAGGNGNIAGFSARHGRLHPIKGSSRALSGPGAAPGQVSITPNGREVVVTEKATQLIDVFKLNARGIPTSRTSVRSSGATPFGFDFTRSGRLAVSEAGPSATSVYKVYPYGLRTIAASVENKQAAACWVAVTDNSKYLYTGNGGGSQSISGYRVTRNGHLRLLTADGRTGTAPAGVSDIALSDGSKYLYSRLSDGSVGAFRVGHNGGLTRLAGVPGLPDGAAGIAAW